MPITAVVLMGLMAVAQDLKFQLVCRFKYVKNVGTMTLRVGPAEGTIRGIIIAAMLTLVGDNGSGDEVSPPPQPPSHPAQVSMKADDWNLKQSPDLVRIWGDWKLKHGGVSNCPLGQVEAGPLLLAYQPCIDVCPLGSCGIS